MSVITMPMAIPNKPSAHSRRHFLSFQNKASKFSCVSSSGGAPVVGLRCNARKPRDTTESGRRSGNYTPSLGFRLY